MPLKKCQSKARRGKNCETFKLKRAAKLKALSKNPPLIENTESSCHTKNVYCIPMESSNSVPCPDERLKDLLNKYGLKGRVTFSSHSTPAKIREDISKAFKKTFSLRHQELLQFDYLCLSPNKRALTKPQNMHFDSKAIESFADDEDLYILLRQTSLMQDINWKQLLRRDNNILNLSDEEYREIMLSVMYRLSSGKHKKGATQDQQDFIEKLLHNYKLNSCHQLVHTGEGLEQLVLFTEKRRSEAFVNAHTPAHLNAEETYKIIFKSFHWRGMKDWVVKQVNACVECAKKTNERDELTEVDELVNKKRKIESNGKEAHSDKGDKQDNENDGDNDLSSETSTVADGSMAICANSMSAMYEFQKNETFCDFIIFLLPSAANRLENTKVYNVHRVVLAAVSSRIRDIPKTSIKIGGNVSTDCLQAIIEFAYIGQISNVQKLPINIIGQISNTALALNIKIIDYLQNARPDFMKISTTKLFVTKSQAQS